MLKEYAGLSRWLLMLALVVQLAACMGNKVVEDSRRLIQDGRPEEGLFSLEQAMRAHPQDTELRAAYFRQRELVIAQLIGFSERERMAGHATEAEQHLRTALRIEPGNERVQAGLNALSAARRREERLQGAEQKMSTPKWAEAEPIIRAVLAEDPMNQRAQLLLRKLDIKAMETRPSDSQTLSGPFSKPITMEFRDAPLRNVFEVISRTAGINFVFDKDVRPDAKVTVFVRNSTIDDVMKLILTTNQLERKLLNANSVLIYPSNAAKQREYQELVTRAFYLANTEAKQAQTLIKQVVKTKDIFIDDKLNLLVIKDTPEAVRLAERLIQVLDVADPEVMLDVEVLEISRNKLLELGIRYPDVVGYGRLTPDTVSTTTNADGTVLGTTTTFGGDLGGANISLRSRSGLVPYVVNPGLLLNLKDQDGDSKTLANPRIRVLNREKAKIHIGDKLPVFTTTATTNVGVSSSVNYLDVGLKLDVEPTVQLDGEVSIKVGLEVSSIAREVPGPNGSLAYQIGTRNANTVLRLRDGETQVLAGLISNEERNSANRFPGLGELPIIGRLFSNQRDSTNKTEIVLLITPHVIRNIMRPELAAATLSSGTEASIGAAPLIIGDTTGKKLDVRGASFGASTTEGRGRYRQMPSQPPMSAAEAEDTGGSAEGGETPSAGAAEQAAANKEASSSETQSATPAATISGPSQVAQGSEFLISAVVQGASLLTGGTLTLHYDANLFESVSPSGSGGTVTVPLRGGSNTASGLVRFKARAGFSGAGSISIADGNVVSNGAEQPITAGASTNVTVQ